jgi:large subunit ribosomal protein L6
MSRIGRMPIALPTGAQVEISGNDVKVKGPKGELRWTCPPEVSIVKQEKQLIVSRSSDDKRCRAMHGLSRSLVANMVQGVTAGFEKSLEVVGAGYRARKEGDKVVLQVGFSHPVEVSPLPGTSLAVEGANRIKVTGADKQVVGEMAAKIRSIRPPDVYKGKGVRYAGEQIKLKPGKKAVGRKK